MLSAIFSWDTLWILLVVLYVPACAGLIGVVLLQKGKGVGFAGAFGVGAGSDTVFGPRMSKSLPVKITYVMAGMFMVIAMAMSLIAGRITKGVAPDLVDPAQQEVINALSGFEERGLGGDFPAGDAIPQPPVTIEVEESADTEAPAADAPGTLTIPPVDLSEPSAEPGDQSSAETAPAVETEADPENNG